MNYQDEVIALLRAAGHTVELKPNRYSAKEWHIGDTPLGSNLIGAGSRVSSVVDHASGGVAWRARKLTGDPKKDAKMILDRADAVKTAAARQAADNKRRSARADKRALLAAMMPGAVVNVGDRVHVTFEFADLTPEQAKRLHEAVMEAVR